MKERPCGKKTGSKSFALKEHQKRLPLADVI
jgi:hypothetical protein